jgi:hypothetical protein
MEFEQYLLMLLGVLLSIVTLIGVKMLKNKLVKFTINQIVIINDIKIKMVSIAEYEITLIVSYLQNNVNQKRIIRYIDKSCRYKVGDVITILLSAKNNRTGYLTNFKIFKQLNIILFFGLFLSFFVTLFSLQYQFEFANIIFDCLFSFSIIIYIIYLLVLKLKDNKVRKNLNIKTEGNVSAISYNEKDKLCYVVAEYTVDDTAHFTRPLRLSKINKEEIKYKIGDVVNIAYSENSDYSVII